MHLGRPEARRNHTFVHLLPLTQDGEFIVFTHLGGGEKAPACGPALITPPVLMMHLLMMERVSGWK